MESGKCLFIRYKEPEAINEGGGQCTDTNLSVLKELFGEKNVETYSIHRKSDKKTTIFHLLSIFFHFLKGYYYGLSPRKVAKIVQISQNYSYIFIDRSLFGIVARDLKKNNYQGKIITFFHNIEAAYFKAKIAEWKPWRSIVVGCANKNDSFSCYYSDKIIALNKRDGGELEKRYHRKTDIYSPITFKDVYNKVEYPSEITPNIPVCLFLGTYFPMNVQGILWFVKEVLPNVTIRLQIVGKGMNTLNSSLPENSQIEVFSDVPELCPYIEKADFMLLPIFKGSGMKVKTGESLMYGKNIIGTNEAFEGYELDYNRVGALCNTKEEFIDSLNYFSQNPQPRFNSYSREIFLQKYTDKERLNCFRKIFEDRNLNDLSISVSR